MSFLVSSSIINDFHVCFLTWISGCRIGCIGRSCRCVLVCRLSTYKFVYEIVFVESEEQHLAKFNQKESMENYLVQRLVIQKYMIEFVEPSNYKSADLLH